MPREGQVIAACRATATLPTLRYSTVPACGLRTVLKQEARPLLERFQEASRAIGCYRHLTSLAANALVTRDPERYADVADWKSFYDKVFSAVEAAVLRTSKPTNPYAADVAAILDDGSADLDWREALPQKELFDLRQQVAVQMATNAKEHLLQFRERLHAFLVAELAPHAPSLSSASLRSIGWKAVEAALSAPSVTTERLSTLEASLPASARAAAVGRIEVERLRLGTLAQEASASGAKRRRDDAVESDAQRILRTSERLAALLPHLQRYSVAAQRKGEEEEEASASSDDVSDEDADAIAARPAVVGGRRFRRCERPKPFMLLPLSKLRPEMVLYTFTEVDTLCRAYARAARKARTWVPPETEKLDFVSGLFDLTTIKGKAGVTVDGDQKWRVAAFRTNGVEVCLTFVSGHVEQAPNVSALLEAKYNIPFPTEPIDVRTQARGLFCATQSRNDLAPCSDASGLRIAAVDPGFVKPVAVSVLAEATDDCADSEQWHVSEEEWMRDSGRLERRRTEEHRRRRSPAYAEAIEQLSAVRRYSASAATVAAYLRASLATLGARVTELVCTARSIVGMRAKRVLLSFLSRLSDRLFDRSSCRPSRAGRGAKLSEEEREALRSKLREARERRTERTSVVFFGNGSFGCTMRGHNSIPKKQILKHLAVRGVTVLLDEFRTSKMCPCGLSSLTHVIGDRRLRCHQAGGSDECRFTCPSSIVRDRDSLATLNMLQCAQSCLLGHRWPSHLSRTS